MRRRPATVLLLSAIMILTTCVPAGAKVYAAENAADGLTVLEQAAPEEEQDGEEATEAAEDIEDMSKAAQGEEPEDLPETTQEESPEDVPEAFAGGKSGGQTCIGC